MNVNIYFYNRNPYSIITGLKSQEDFDAVYEYHLIFIFTNKEKAMQGFIARICTSFIDVPGKIAIAIYFSGCSIRCKDCQNKALWDKNSGTAMDIDAILEKINKHPLAESIVFLGGEPTDQPKALHALCAKITDKEKVLYTGREFEELPDALLPHLDLIICGPYRSDLHVGGWPASSNQRVLKKKGKIWTVYRNI